MRPLDVVGPGNGHTLRWNLVKVIQEDARHNGHADLIRQAIDEPPANDSPVLCWNDAVNVADVLIDLYGRLPPLCHEAVEGLTPEQLVQPPAPGATRSDGWCGTWRASKMPRSQS